MNSQSIALISKDILMPDYLPVYGNKYWKTPNIDQLANKGTVFMRHYAAAPSTAMSFTSMFVGKYPYELDRKKYEHVKNYDKTPTLFDELRMQGYENHILWSNNYMTKALPYSRSFGGDKTIFHCLDINQPAGPHIKGLQVLERDDAKAVKTMQLIFKEIESLPKDRKIFLWIHLPHVILGRISYGDDIDLLDELIGFLRGHFSDSNIFITADHGNMNGQKGKWAYGFDVYEPAIRIPLIVPRINDISNISYPTSNIQLKEIILERNVSKKDYILSDSAYYGQLHRKLAIITTRFKYIYNKQDKTEELYDLQYDHNENINLLVEKVWDNDRKRYNNVREVYFYPYWIQSLTYLKTFREIRNSIWREGNKYEELLNKTVYYTKRAILRPYSAYRIHKKMNRK